MGVLKVRPVDDEEGSLGRVSMAIGRELLGDNPDL
jgi:hypothetical protein